MFNKNVAENTLRKFAAYLTWLVRESNVIASMQEAVTEKMAKMSEVAEKMAPFSVYRGQDQKWFFLDLAEELTKIAASREAWVEAWKYMPETISGITGQESVLLTVLVGQLTPAEQELKKAAESLGFRRLGFPTETFEAAEVPLCAGTEGEGWDTLNLLRKEGELWRVTRQYSEERDEVWQTEELPTKDFASYADALTFFLTGEGEEKAWKEPRRGERGERGGRRERRPRAEQ